MQFSRPLEPKLNQQRKLGVLPDVVSGNVTSEIIHQSFPTRQLPDEIEENVNQLKAMNPHWEYRFYEDRGISEFIKQNDNDKVLEYYNRINPSYGAARADFFRYLVICKCAGIYIDIKSTATLPFDSFLKDSDCFLLSHRQNKKGEEYEGFSFRWDLEVPDGEFQQWHVISAPGHPFLKAVIENILINIDLYLPSFFTYDNLQGKALHRAQGTDCPPRTKEKNAVQSCGKGAGNGLFFEMQKACTCKENSWSCGSQAWTLNSVAYKKDLFYAGSWKIQ